ncbi:leucine-rich repeat extensin-like protein 3 [Iris pallida]|uniref:Leucine-rich repeat extensin-like protein 3 n=1 Tax=Iris pallida TaxID=29817 RepID=A0AAX6FDG5_IRIPA|nr:leucine-rich repeat extensin-like protein 3 [Iris pallida]
MPWRRWGSAMTVVVMTVVVMLWAMVIANTRKVVVERWWRDRLVAMMMVVVKAGVDGKMRSGHWARIGIGLGVLGIWMSRVGCVRHDGDGGSDLSDPGWKNVFV